MPLHARVINCPCAGSNGVPMAFRQQAIQTQNPVLRVCFLDPLLHQFSSLEFLKGEKKRLVARLTCQGFMGRCNSRTVRVRQKGESICRYKAAYLSSNHSFTRKHSLLPGMVSRQALWRWIPGVWLDTASWVWVSLCQWILSTMFLPSLN